MLISSSLAALGKSLKSSSPNMETKGVASHRSPVTTLNHYLPPGSKPLHHDSFVRAVTSEFSKIYSTAEMPMATHTVSKNSLTDEKVWKGYDELQHWDWQYGQTPEFTNEIEGNFSWGTISVSLKSRHALLTSLTFHLSPPLHSDIRDIAQKQAYLDSLALSLVGKRYESLDGAEGAMGSQWDDERWRDFGNEVLHWLRKAM